MGDRYSNWEYIYFPEDEAMAHTTDAIVVHCIDFRFQKFVSDWLDKNLGDLHYDRVALAGGIFDLYTILKQVSISDRLHKIKKVILLNHEDCGAYGVEGTHERHVSDLMAAENVIEKLYPHLDVETYYIHLDGTFEQLSATAPRK